MPRLWLRLRRPAVLGSAAMYTEGTASRPPTAKGPLDIGVQENEIGARVVTLGVLAAHTTIGECNQEK